MAPYVCKERRVWEFCLNLSIMDGVKTPCSITASTHRSPSTQMRCVCTEEQTAIFHKLFRTNPSTKQNKNQETKLSRGLTNVAIYYHQVVAKKSLCGLFWLQPNWKWWQSLAASSHYKDLVERESGDCTLQPGHLLPYPKKRRKKKKQKKKYQKPQRCLL